MVLITSTSGRRWPPTPDHRASPTASAAACRVLARSGVFGPAAASTDPAVLFFALSLALAYLLWAAAVWRASAASAAIINILVADTFVMIALVGMPPPGSNCHDRALRTLSSDVPW